MSRSPRRTPVLLAACLSLAPCLRAPATGPCELLSDAEIRIVQGEAPVARVGKVGGGDGFRLSECHYRTSGAAGSLKVAVAVPLAHDVARSGPRGYWRRRFHAGTPRRPHDAPRAVPGLGEEAFWVREAALGALYVLKGDVFLRLIVEGRFREDQRTDRASALAAQALKRLVP